MYHFINIFNMDTLLFKYIFKRTVLLRSGLGKCFNTLNTKRIHMLVELLLYKVAYVKSSLKAKGLVRLVSLIYGRELGELNN